MRKQLRTMLFFSGLLYVAVLILWGIRSYPMEEQAIVISHEGEHLLDVKYIRTMGEDGIKEISFDPEYESKTHALSKFLEEKLQKKEATLVEQELNLIAVGDNLLHTQVIRSGLGSDGTYNFSHLFDGIKEELNESDVAIINQETILCDASLGYTGYPTFGSPFEVGEAIVEAGFDVILQANNHTMDKGYAGIEDTIAFWKQYEEMVTVGINETEDPMERLGLITKQGITIAVLNYTYGLNGLSVPKGKDYLVNTLLDREQIQKDIALAKEISDFVIVCPHWGSEYVYQPTQQQKEWTRFFANEGVDLILGSHPHVLQPVEWVENEDGTHRMLVYYSLGNFVSNQDAMARMLGGMAKVKLVRRDGKVVIEEASIEPLVTHTYYDNKQRFTTYLLKEYDTEMAVDHYLNQKTKHAVTMDALTKLTETILGEWYVVESKTVSPTHN